MCWTESNLCKTCLYIDIQLLGILVENTYEYVENKKDAPYVEGASSVVRYDMGYLCVRRLIAFLASGMVTSYSNDKATPASLDGLWCMVSFAMNLY